MQTAIEHICSGQECLFVWRRPRHQLGVEVITSCIRTEATVVMQQQTAYALPHNHRLSPLNTRPGPGLADPPGSAG